MARGQRRFRHRSVSRNQSSCTCACLGPCICIYRGQNYQSPVQAPAPWTDLPPDVLRDISGRLHHAVEYVRFHAVCKSWRDTSVDTIAIPTTTVNQHSFPPWLLAPNFMDLKFRCVFSRTSYRAAPKHGHHNLVASADGAAILYLVDGPCPTLRDLLTGVVITNLPPFPKRIKKWIRSETPNSTIYDLSSIVYGDGTTLLYGLYETNPRDAFRANFWAALLHPGEPTWTVVERMLESQDTGNFCVAYHLGKILVTIEPNLLQVVMPDDYHGVGDVVVPSPWMPGERKDYISIYNYLIESHGELLWASVQVCKDYMDQWRRGEVIVPHLIGALSVSVHILKEDMAAPQKMQWVRKDGEDLANRVLFLGWLNSFAVEASRLGGDDVSGGCAYFVYDVVDYMSEEDMMSESCYVFRYNLVDDKAKFVKKLPHGWDDDLCMWLFPQPAVTPIQEIIERRRASKWKKEKQQRIPTPRSIIHIERPQHQDYKSYFMVIVRNLPHEVDNFQLHQFFGKHGKVTEAKVRCKKKTNISKGFGHVTMLMVEEQTEALTTLDGLVLGGSILEVSLVETLRLPEQHVNFVGSKAYSLCHRIYVCLTLLLFVLVVLWKSI